MEACCVGPPLLWTQRALTYLHSGDKATNQSHNSFGLATVGDRELVMTVMAKAEAQREAELQLSRAL